MEDVVTDEEDSLGETSTITTMIPQGLLLLLFLFVYKSLYCSTVAFIDVVDNYYSIFIVVSFVKIMISITIII